MECRPAARPWLLASCNYGAMWRLHGAIPHLFTVRFMAIVNKLKYVIVLSFSDAI